MINPGRQLIMFAALLCPSVCFSQSFLNAHAHNDYEHTHPLFDALHYGFNSVEADVHLVNGKLLVSHTYPLFGAKTLEELYLIPLDSIVHTNKGRIFPRYPGTFYLMIDIKTEAKATYNALKGVLLRFPSLLRSAENHPVTIFLSGNRPVDLIVDDPLAPVSLDGRPGDLGKSYSSSTIPVISDNFNQWSDWNGEGAGNLEKIEALAKRVHAEGKKLRLWAIPDNPNSWKVLLESGVDIINTDHLQELNDFLKKQGK